MCKGASHDPWARHGAGSTIGSMKVIACLLVLGACTEEGANLTLSAPNGPSAAASYELVLASTDLVPVIPDQRVSPTQITAETVTYYLQRTSANAGGSVVGLDGFRVRVEPNPSVAETAFIPFALFYDDQHRVIAIGAYHGTEATPQPILVKRGEIDAYTLDVEPVTEVADAAPVAAGDALQVTCSRPDQTTFRSGVVWRTAGGTELRIMLPDQDGASDASTRALDLDCDGQAVVPAATSADCDDTRARFHSGAADVCDGEDTNCDAVPYVVVPCTSTSSGPCNGTNTGVALCAEATQQTGACSADVSCACQAGTAGCAKCVLPVAHGTSASTVTACLPALDATVETQGYCSEAPCIVDVLGTRGGWTATVAATESGPFAQIAPGVTSSFALRLTRPDDQIAGVPGGSVGAVDLSIVSPTTGPKLVSFDLQPGQIDTCAGNGPFAMTCAP